MSKKIYNLFRSYIDLTKDHLIFAIIIIAIITGVSVFASSKLAIKSDLKALLPDNYQSIKELNKMLEHIGGTGSLIVVAESPDLDANKDFMNKLSKEIKTLPQGLVRYNEYKVDDVNEYYEKNVLHYLNNTDLDFLYSSVVRRIDQEKLKTTGLYIDFEEEGKDPLISDIDYITNKNEKDHSAPIRTIDGYYGGYDGKMLIMIIRPFGASLTVEKARNLIASIKNIVNKINPKTLSPNLKIGYCGNVVSTVEEYDTLKKDILSTAILCISLVSLVIILYFLKLRIVFLLGSTLLIALSWTFALTYIFIGYLNTQTAFLGSIIIGTGINYGIILMARYVEERKKNIMPAIAMKEALVNTLSSTFLAAATTAVAFSILLLAKIKGLSQFGIIGAIGVLFCWIAAMLVLPVLTLASEKIYNMIKNHTKHKIKHPIFEGLSLFIANSSYKIIIVAAIFTIISIVAIARFAPNSIEYDFSKMRNKTSVSSGTEALENRVSKLFGHSMTPAVVLTKQLEDAPLICNAVQKKNQLIPEEERRVGSCYSIYSLLPKDQESKKPYLDKFKKLLDEKKDLIAKLNTDEQDQIAKIRSSLDIEKITLSDLPKTLTKHFQDIDGNEGAVVFINPKPGMYLSDGRNLIKFADTIKNIKVADGRVFHAAGASFIFSDLVKAIKNQAPFLTLVSFIAVLIFIAIVVGRWYLSGIILFSLVIGIMGMCGLISIFNIKLNFFNFIALPLTFGIGADYVINIVLRLQRDQMDNVGNALRHTGAAVMLCSSTTIIGYSVLIIANNQALASFGTLAILGEIACIFAAVILAPALMVALRKYLFKKNTHQRYQRNKV